MWTLAETEGAGAPIAEGRDTGCLVVWLSGATGRQRYVFPHARPILAPFPLTPVLYMGTAAAHRRTAKSDARNVPRHLAAARPPAGSDSMASSMALATGRAGRLWARPSTRLTSRPLRKMTNVGTVLRQVFWCRLRD